MKKIKFDIPFISLWLVLMSVGLLAVFSSSSVSSLEATNNSSTFLFLGRQLIYIAVGFIVMVAVSRTDYRRWRAYTIWLNIVVIVLLCLVSFTPLGVEVNGAKRWISLFGFQFQPSEIAKIVIILTTALMIERYERYDRLNTLVFYGRLGAYLTFYIALISVPQNHASVAMIIVLVVALMLFFGGMNKIIFLGAGVIASMGGIAVALSSEFRRERILSFLDPFSNDGGESYQIVQNWLALGSGEYMGVGLGYGRQKFGWLPENHTDFILGVLGEEMGFIGIAVVLMLFFLLIARGFYIAINAKDNFGLLIVSGVIGLIAIQVVINASVVSGLFPVTGVPLPFISYGGTYTIALSVMVGMVMSVYKRIDDRDLSISDEVEINLRL